MTGQMTAYNSAGGASINGSYDQKQTSTRSTTHQQSIFTANHVILDIENDLHQEGATIRSTTHLETNIGGNWYLESQQNRSNSRNAGFGVSGGVSFGGTEESGKKTNADGSANYNQGLSDIGLANGVNFGASNNNGLTDPYHQK